MNKISERIKKLLALAQSPNQHEAELAASRAAVLMASYNLDPHKDNKEVTNKFLVVYDEWQKILVAGIGKSCFCLVINQNKVVNIIGEEENIDSCISFSQYLLHQILTLMAKAKNPEGRTNREYLTKWAFGVVARVLHRILNDKKTCVENVTNGKEIVRVMDSKNYEFAKQMYGKELAKANLEVPSGYEQGWRDGIKVQINDSLIGERKKLA